MKHSIYLYLAIIALVSLTTACQKVITVDLDNAASQMVIEASINDQPGGQKVVLSKTTSYFETIPQQFFSGAKVSMSDNNGNTYNFDETSRGIYTNKLLQGKPGTTYMLTVIAEGKTYTATSAMPMPVNIDSISYERRTSGGLFGGGGNKGRKDTTYRVFCNFKDPPELGNYYRFSLKVLRPPADTSTDTVPNRTRYILADDRLTNGNQGSYGVSGNRIYANDTVLVQLQCITKATFDYYSVVNSLLESDRQEASPANPPTNMKGGALGYFSAYSVKSTKRLIKRLP